MRNILCSMMLLCCYNCMACDVCGASGNNGGLGILPQFQSHFVGLQYQQRVFHTKHTSLHEGSVYDHSDEYYHTMQLWGGVRINKRIQFFAFLPYQYNVQKIGSTQSKYNGFGDLSVVANAIIIRTPATSDRKWNHWLMAGVGIKAPTGKRYDAGLSSDSVLNIQPGTGSWDYLLNANYTARYKKIGLNVECAYTVTTSNNDDYKFGNRLNAGMHIFYRYQKSSVTIVPQAGVKVDYALHDYDNYSRKWLNVETGGYLTYSSFGVQAFYKSIGLQSTYNIPVFQNYAVGQVVAKRKIDIGLLFIF